MEIPPTLRQWFLAHFVANTAVGAPLFLAPQWLLARADWPCVDSLTARLVGAALIAIGGQSFLSRNAGIAEYRTLLSLFSMWSAAAVVGTFVAIGFGAPPAAWAALSAFLVFTGVFNNYRVRLRQMAEAKEATDDEAAEAANVTDDSVDPLG